MPDTYAYFFIPNYPSDIATVNFDFSGTTRLASTTLTTLSWHQVLLV